MRLSTCTNTSRGALSPTAWLAARAPRQLQELSVQRRRGGPGVPPLHQGTVSFPAHCSPLLSWHRWWTCCAWDAMLLHPFLGHRGITMGRGVSSLWADAEGQWTWVRQVRWISRWGWLLFTEGGTAVKLRSAWGESQRHEGHGAVAAMGQCVLSARGAWAPGGPHSRVVILKLACFGLLESSKEDGFRTLFLQSEGEGRLLTGRSLGEGGRVGSCKEGCKVTVGERAVQQFPWSRWREQVSSQHSVRTVPRKAVPACACVV